MPRPLAEYTLADWVHLRPVLHTYKTQRYRLIRHLYLRQPPKQTGLAALTSKLPGTRLLVTIAFDDPEILSVQLAAVRRHVAGALHIVADNSMIEENATTIEKLCTQVGIAYIRLPPNPWSPRVPSRSHGLALDWVWQHLIQPGRPESFGFLDHDLIPVEQCDPFDPLRRQPIHGDKRWAGRRWFLWAGYCFFQTDFLIGKKVDFGQDWFVGLDTGGGNWRSIYHAIDPASLEERPIDRIPVSPDVSVQDFYIERRGAWLHEVGFDARPSLKALKRERFLNLVRLQGLPTTAL